MISALALSAAISLAPRQPIDWCAFRRGVDADLAAAKVRTDAKLATRIRALYLTPEEIKAITPRLTTGHR